VRRHFRWINYLLSAGVLTYVVWHLHLGDLAQKLAGADWTLLGLAVGVSAGAGCVAAVRWHYLLGRRLPYRNVVQANYLGQLVNEVLPLKTGEVVRGLVVARRARMGVTAVISTEIVERLSDAFATGILVWVVASTIQLPPALGVVRTVLQIGIPLFLLVIFVIAWRERSVRRWLLHWKPGGRLRARARRIGLDLTSGLRLLQDPRAVGVAAAVAVACVAVQVTALWLALRAFAIELDPVQAAGVLTVISIGTVIPSTPGNVGSWQFFCVLGLGLYGVEASTAAGFSLVVFALFTLALIGGGIVALVTSPFSLAQLRDVRSLPHPRGELPAGLAEAET